MNSTLKVGRWMGVRSGRAVLTAILVAMGTFGGTSACADDVYWSNPAGGDWSVGANWSMGSPPVAGDRAFITLPGEYTVTVDVNPPQLAGLTLGDGVGGQSLNGDGRVFSMTGPFLIQGGELLAGATISLGGPEPRMAIDDGLWWLSGAVIGGRFEFNGGQLVSHASSLLTMTNVELVGNPLTLGGTTCLNGCTVNLNLTNAGTLTNCQNAANLVVNGSFENLAGATFGAATGNGSGEFTFTNGLVNGGLIEIGSTGNGANRIVVSGGPLTNLGQIVTVNSRGELQRITAEVVNEPTGSIIANVAPLDISGQNAQHINRGLIRNIGIMDAPGGNGQYTLDGGVVQVDGGTNVISGARFQYLSGTFNGAGALLLSGMELYGNPMTNTMSPLCLNQCVVNLDLSNAGLLTDCQNAANLLVNGAFHNLPGGTLRAATGSSGGLYTFTNGLLNDGLIEIGSTGNGANRIVVSGGPLTNLGQIVTVNSRGELQRITAEVVNEPTGSIAANAAPLEIDGLNALLINRGLISGTHDLTLLLNGTARLQNEEHGVIQANGGGRLTLAGAAFQSSPWIDNRGSIESNDNALTVVSAAPGRHVLNAADARMVANGGTFILNLGGTMHSDGCLEVASGARMGILGNVPDNYNVATQTWTGGCLKIEGPGELCFPIANAGIRTWSASLECIHEPMTCSAPGSASDLFSGIEEITSQGEFILNDMSMTTQQNFTVNGSAMLVNGAVLMVPGTLHSNGNIVVNQSTVIPQSVVIGQGQFVGDGFVGGHIVNNGGTIQPGSQAAGLRGEAGDPGRFDATQDYTQGIGGSLEIEVGGYTQGEEYDLLSVAQTATLGGHLEVRLINGFEPMYGDTFAVVQGAVVVGEFDSLSLPPQFKVRYTSGSVIAIYPCPSDINADGGVESQDLFEFFEAFFAGDADINGVDGTDSQDYFDFLEAFFNGC